MMICMVGGGVRYNSKRWLQKGQHNEWEEELRKQKL